MRKCVICLTFVFCVLIFVQFSHPALGQGRGTGKPVMLVSTFAPGGIELPSGEDWKPRSLTIHDNGRRPVALFQRTDGLSVSFILFENLYDTATSKGCRKDAMDGIVDKLGSKIAKRMDAEKKLEGNRELATTSYLMSMAPDVPGKFQHNTFGFVAGAKVCAEIHVSSVNDSPEEEEKINSIVSGFKPDVDFKPTSADYFLIASLLFRNAPGDAAPYFKASLAAMPKDDSFKTARRVATDQLVMALGMSGDMKSSRAVAEAAIQADPDYPINYYNLACADAEENNASQARNHLQQAFDRRANVLKGETMPDPTRDDSIMKLKTDKAFWEFVLKLPKG
jgi:hypothetical protein